MAAQKEMLHSKAVLEWAKENNKPIIVFDTETTGLKAKQDVIIQISAQKIDPDNFEVIDVLDLYINPERELPKFIIDLTGVTNEKIKKYPTETEVFSKINDFFEEKSVLIGHNVPFDIKFLSAMYERQNSQLNIYDGALYLCIDTCQMARELLKRNVDVENHKLRTVASYYGADAGLTFHNSMDDVIACYRIFRAMYTGTKVAGKKCPDINGVDYVFGYKGHDRVYVQTNMGTIYYDTLDKCWESREFDVNFIDICDFVKKLYKMCDVENDFELCKKIYKNHCNISLLRVGRVKRAESLETAKTISKKMNEKHFDTKIEEKKECFVITLTAFHKSSMGTTVIC